MGVKALVVDNDFFFVEFVTELLEARGYQVFKAYDGKEAISKLEEESVDLLFVDMIMPKIDGKQLITFARKRFVDSSFAIVALSGVMIENLESLENIGADYFLAKGPMEKMAEHIENLLDKIENDPVFSSSEDNIFKQADLMPRQITDELIQTVNFHRAIIQCIGMGVLVVDRDARIITTNSIALHIIGKSIDEMLNRQITSIFPENDRPMIIETLKNLIFKSESGRIDFLVAINSRQIRVIASLFKLDGEINGYIFILEETG
jgi:PAS domain S-box-containing protein